MNKISMCSTTLLTCLIALAPALAHSPICSCRDNGNSTITCEGGFSDGSSAAGAAIRVVDARDRVLLSGKMTSDSEFTFDRPGGEFHVIFDAGQNHIVNIFSGDID